MNYKIIGSTVSALVLFGSLLCCTFSGAVAPDRTELFLHLSFIVMGATLGWIVGIFVSPYSEREKGQFTGIAKGVTVFFSGYALAKIDPIITATLSPEAFSKTVVIFRTVAFLTSFLLAMLIVFIYRKYAR